MRVASLLCLRNTVTVANSVHMTLPDDGKVHSCSLNVSHNCPRGCLSLTTGLHTPSACRISFCYQLKHIRKNTERFISTYDIRTNTSVRATRSSVQLFKKKKKKRHKEPMNVVRTYGTTLLLLSNSGIEIFLAYNCSIYRMWLVEKNYLQEH